jgi:hypothetical protein
VSRATFESDHGRSDVRAVRRNPWVMMLAAVPLMLTLVPLWMGALGNASAFFFVFHPLIFGIIALLYAHQRNPMPRIEDARVRANAESLWIDGERVPRDEIRAAVLMPGPRPRLHIERKRKPAVELEVESEQVGRRLLDAMGLGEAQTVASFRAGSRLMAGAWRLFALSFAGALGVLMLGGLFSMLHPMAAPAGMAIGGLALMTLMMWPATVDVGIDGVLVRWLGRERFIPHASIERATLDTQSAGRSKMYVVDLLLESGEEYRIPVANTAWDFGKTSRLHQRISDARDAHRRGVPAEAAALIERGRRSHIEWVQALRANEARANLRRAPLEPDKLWRIVEDVQSAPLERAAAATALSGAMNDGERRRLQRIASATAAPRLRIALDAAGSDDEQALAEALAELDQQATTDT